MTFATELHAAGHRTAYVGKYLNGCANDTCVPPGWDRWLAFTNAGLYDYRLEVDGALEPGPTIRAVERLVANVDFAPTIDRRARGGAPSG